MTDDTRKAKALGVLVAGGTRAEAAEAAGVNPATVYRWLSGDEAFQGFLEGVKTAARRRLEAAAYDAAEALHEAIGAEKSDTKDHAVAIRASTAVLDRIGVGPSSTVTSESTVRVGSAADYATMSTDELQRAIAELEAKRLSIEGGSDDEGGGEDG